jgi:cephalosporin hydroxylase
MPLAALIAHVQDRVMDQSTYAGVKCVKSPTDWWVYQELLWELRPDVVVEIGNLEGGSALALAHTLDNIGHGYVIGVDIDHSRLDPRADHDRIRWIEAPAVAAAGRVAAETADAETVMVIEDSSHTFHHTLDVLRSYAEVVTVGSYFIVEDGICWHGLDHGPKPGPFEAVLAFVAEDDRWHVDRTKESFMLTWNPAGYLRRLG